MTGWRAVLAFLAAGCGRVAFDPIEGPGDGSAMFDRDFTRGERDGIVIQRESEGSYLDANGVLRFAAADEPRFDHDPNTLEPLGVLVESAKQNYSELGEVLEDDIPWFSNGMSSVIADAAIAPDGTQTADAVVDQETTIDTRRGQGIDVPDDTQEYTFSIFVKAGTRQRMTFAGELLLGAQQIQTHMTVDLVTGAILETSPTLPSALGVEPYPDGWYRVWLTLRNNGTGNIDAILSVWSERTDVTTTGSVYAWGAQLEHGALSSYIRTGAGATGGRAADELTSSAGWLAHDAGTLRAIADVTSETETRQPAVCLAADPTRRACIDRDGTAGRSALTVIGANTSSLLGEPWLRHSRRVTIAAWSDAGSALWDGSLHESNVRVATPISEVRFGGDGALHLEGHLRRITYWPERIASDELPELGTQ